MNTKTRFLQSVIAAAIILASAVGCQKSATPDQGTSTPPQVSAPRSNSVTPRPTVAAARPQQSSDNAPAPQTQPAPRTAQKPAPAAEPPITTPEAALQRLEKNSGLVFSAGTKVLGFGDGGVPDPSIGFYEWLVVSPIPLSLPNGRQVGDSDVSSLPIAQAVQLVESKLNGAKVDNPQTAFSTGWQMGGFAFNGTWIRAQGADYLIVQRTRQ